MKYFLRQFCIKRNHSKRSRLIIGYIGRCNSGVRREFLNLKAQTTAMVTARTSFENEHSRKHDYFAIIGARFCFYIVWKTHYMWTGRNPADVNVEDEIFINHWPLTLQKTRLQKLYLLVCVGQCEEEFYNGVSTNSFKVEWETERFAVRVVAGKSVSNSFVTWFYLPNTWTCSAILS